MTHTAGFEEALEGLLADAAAVPPPIKSKYWVPRRTLPGRRPPTQLCDDTRGYIVQRVWASRSMTTSTAAIFQPLGMADSTFSEPLPANLAPDMSKGYVLASQPPRPFEMFAVRPAGSATSSADDMAKFMLAHLDVEHGGLLKSDTARQMHNSPLTLLPPLDRLELCFYEQNLNGINIVGHGGDTSAFHSYPWLLPEQRIGGIFYSRNSAGRGATSLIVREALIRQFMDRYFPMSASRAPGFKPRSTDAAAVAGTYLASRRSESGLRRALSFFGQTPRRASDASGGLIASGIEFQGANGVARHFVEIAPFVRREDNGSERLAALVQDGKVRRFSADVVSPFTVYDRVPWYASTAWLRPAAILSVLLLLGLLLSFPAGWIARRYYGAGRRFLGTERSAYRSTGAAALVTAAILTAWLRILLTLRFQPLGGAVYLLQILTIIVLPVLCLVSAWFFWTGLKTPRRWLGLLGRAAMVLAALCIQWIAIIFNLTHIGVHY